MADELSTSDTSTNKFERTGHIALVSFIRLAITLKDESALTMFKRIFVSFTLLLLLASCATSPTGCHQLMLVSEDSAIASSKQAYVQTVNELDKADLLHCRISSYADYGSSKGHGDSSKLPPQRPGPRSGGGPTTG